jgi:multidrug transporter EmrE-like cation transporter
VTSEFVSTRLDPDDVQSGHKGIYWFGQEWSYVQWILLLLVLSCTGVLVVGITSFREREQISGLFWGGVCVVSVKCVSVVARCGCSSSPDVCVCASPFIVSKGWARVTFVVKR